MQEGYSSHMDISIKHVTFIHKRTEKSQPQRSCFMYFVENFEFDDLMVDDGMARWYDFAMIVSGSIR